MDEPKHYLLSWFPMLLLIGAWLYVARKHNACRGGGNKASDKLAEEQLATEREKLAEARRTNGLIERLLNEQSVRITALENRLGNPTSPG